MGAPGELYINSVARGLIVLVAKVLNCGLQPGTCRSICACTRIFVSQSGSVLAGGRGLRGGRGGSA